VRRRLLILTALALVPAGAAHAAGTLRAGVGRADVTPPTGYYMMGWVTSEAKPIGVWTRLFARAVVLEENGHKYALVAMDANGIPGGLLAQVADDLSRRGFSQQNILISASHTHAQAAGYYNYSTYNTVFMSESTLTQQNVAGTLDPQLYAFMVHQVDKAIERADADLKPAKAGWGQTELLGLTQNRSLEAHLANYGLDLAYGTGTVAMDPGGYADTIDPAVNVLRVDQVVHGRDVPVGVFDTFANHGTSVHASFEYYGADHHASADRILENAIRRAGHVPRSQDVVAAYGNSDEGDQSSGLVHWGPAWADHVGQVEAAAFLRAWRAAGTNLSSSPVIDSRWTRTCFCGRDFPDGSQPADTKAVTGLPLFTGSEEGRGPLYESDHVAFEGDRLPADNGVQGRKIQVTGQQGNSVPPAVPLMALRIGDSLIVSVPGEATVGVGQRLRAAVTTAIAGTGIQHVVVSGLANEYISYFTTPEEFDAQHYEGGSSLYGKDESLVIQFGLADLAQRLAQGQPDPAPYEFDPRNGVLASAPAFSRGAAKGVATKQPAAVYRLARAAFSWTGGTRGFDRPLDRAFVTIQRYAQRRWRRVTDDLGMQIDWSVDDNGAYTARWEVPLSAPIGAYRFVVTANHYRLASKAFAVQLRSPILTVHPVAGGVTLDYPAAVTDVDLTARPAHARGGTVAYVLHGRRHVVSSNGVRIPVPAGAQVPAGAAHDRYGNRNRNAVTMGS
jgi:neutral ceramidase